MTIPAFPGAQGFGSTTAHGRFGEVIRVTNGNDSGLGSLRDALLSDAVATILFDYSGTITHSSKDLIIKKPNKYIAGQSSPGGVELTGNETNFRTRDICCRFIRFRTGDEIDPQDLNHDGIPDWDNRDAANGGTGDDQGGTFPFSTYNGIVDKCSMSWAVDECCTSWFAMHDWTWSRCLITEGLYRSKHPKTVGPPFNPHSMGLLCGLGAHNMSYYLNFVANCNQRMPQLAGVIPGIAPGAYVTDLRNNFFFNWGEESCAVEHPGNRDNIVANYWRKGPNFADAYLRSIRLAESASDAVIYIDGNIGPDNLDGSGDNWNMIRRDNGEIPDPAGHRQSTPFATPTMTTLAAKDVPAYVLANAGATLPTRDFVDRRAAEQGARKCWSRTSDLFFNSMAEAGGVPVLTGGAPPLDSNGDGVPDFYAVKHGFSTSTNIGNQDAGDGESWLGHYLSFIAGDPGAT